MSEEFTAVSANRIRAILQGAELEPGQFVLSHFSSWEEFFGVLNDGVRCEHAAVSPDGAKRYGRGR